jgi:hypothetical protein
MKKKFYFVLLSVVAVNIFAISIFLGENVKASEDGPDTCDCSTWYPPFQVVGNWGPGHDPAGCELTYQETVSCGYQWFEGEWVEVFANDFKCEDSYSTVFCFCQDEGNACNDDDRAFLK